MLGLRHRHVQDPAEKIICRGREVAVENPYAARLREFSSFAFNESDFGSLRGRWRSFFGDPERVVFEIGCSNAEFLSTVAKENPKQGFIGIDWKYKVTYSGAKRVDRLGLKNVSLLRGKAQQLSQIVAPGEVDEFWIFFPDPWAKTSQRKHRLFQPPFLLEAHRALVPSGKIHFKTDHPGYFQWALALFGVPLPDLPEYRAAVEAEASGDRSRKARQIKVRKHERESDLPRPSRELIQAYGIGHMSVNYWEDESRPRTLFSEHQTLFEKLFVKDRLPIYYLELSRKALA